MATVLEDGFGVDITNLDYCAFGPKVGICPVLMRHSVADVINLRAMLKNLRRAESHTRNHFEF